MASSSSYIIDNLNDQKFDSKPLSTLSQEKDSIIDLGEQIVPIGLKVSSNKYGYCLVATKDFKKNEVIYRSVVKTVPGQPKKYRFTIDGKQYISDATNSVKIENERCIYTFDGFMNHSCEQNSISVKKDHYLDFEQVAVKDIKEGDEITCNYLHFDYDCDGHSFQCQCGQKKCYKNIEGFKNLSLTDQISLLPIIDQEMRDLWIKQNPKIVVVDDLRVPQTLQIRSENKTNRKIISKTNFKKGQVVFKNKPLIIGQQTILIAKVEGEYELINLISHTINKGQHRQFLYFDTFMNHSCDPNSKMISQGGYQIQICIKDIKQGDEITCDYSEFDHQNDAEEIQCLCDSPTCRKIIEGVKKNSSDGDQSTSNEDLNKQN